MLKIWSWPTSFWSFSATFLHQFLTKISKNYYFQRSCSATSKWSCPTFFHKKLKTTIKMLQSRVLALKTDKNSQRHRTNKKWEQNFKVPCIGLVGKNRQNWKKTEKSTIGLQTADSAHFTNFHLKCILLFKLRCAFLLFFITSDFRENEYTSM